MGLDVFLSSNSREGYSQDVVDLFAKPCGSSQQFRYASKWISSEVSKRKADAEYDEAKDAVLCYIDQATKNATPLIVPVRFAEIVEVRNHGSTASIVFKLGDFCKYGDLRSFNDKARATRLELPDYHGGELSGKYWMFDNEDCFGDVEGSNDLGDWEHLVEQYYQTPNHVDDVPFYRFDAIKDLKTGKTVEPFEDEGALTFELDGGRSYEVQVYHFHPKRHFSEYMLEVSTGDEVMRSLNGEKRAMSTRYDRKDFRFKTKKSILGEDTQLSFRRKESTTDELIWEDFQVRITTKPSLGLAVLSVSVTAVGFAIPFIVRSLTDPSKDWPVIVGAVVGGAVVGTVSIAKEDYSKAVLLLERLKKKIFG
ncbi:hypothetical protein MWU60_18105 [Yoonia sp. F2084L]|uniref:hypothetical protein n=1 Tax=Yoonia sp. F2084L TaxID=2926419 RepID=UPI001FF534C4|nr:hypothetical protein [Yoonia sp. F2084L]MCK0097496.1 hypothetical protein [Yoonia sp. F2084L]